MTWLEGCLEAPSVSSVGTLSSSASCLRRCWAAGDIILAMQYDHWLQQLTLWISASIKRDDCFWHTVRRRRQHQFTVIILLSTNTLALTRPVVYWVLTPPWTQHALVCHERSEWCTHVTSRLHTIHKSNTYLWSEIFSSEQLLYPQPVIPLPFSDLNKIRSYGEKWYC